MSLTLLAQRDGGRQGETTVRVRLRQPGSGAPDSGCLLKQGLKSREESGSSAVRGKDCVLPYIHLLYIKRQDREIVLRFSVAELWISAETIELCDKLIAAFSEIEFQRISHCEALCVVVAFAVLEQAFKEF
jgi:hypothetical protein